MKSLDYIVAAQQKLGITSDNALAKVLGLTRGAISAVRQGKANLGPDTALKIAAILDVHPAIVLADTSAERSKESVLKSVWESVAKDYRTRKLSDLHITLQPAKLELARV